MLDTVTVQTKIDVSLDVLNGVVSREVEIGSNVHVMDNNVYDRLSKAFQGFSSGKCKATILVEIDCSFQVSLSNRLLINECILWGQQVEEWNIEKQCIKEVNQLWAQSVDDTIKIVGGCLELS